ncbi:MAG: hypothetical protein ACE5I1_15670, partial [bacterium]
MAKKNNLFLLIKSLTKAEKRYFKLFAGMGGESRNYIRLFDCIDRQEEYDEAAIRKHFKNETFVAQLHVTKNYLNRLILKSLRNFHAHTSKDAELKELLRDIEILFKKELFDQCKYAIEKAKALASMYEKHLDLAEIHTWERKLVLAISRAGGGKDALNTIIQNEKSALDRAQNLNAYWHLTLNLFDLLEQTRFNESETKIGHPLLQDECSAESLSAKVLFYHNVQMYAFSKGDFERTEQVSDKMIALIESFPHLIKDNPVSYITTLNNRIGLCLQLKKYEMIRTLLQKVRTLPQKYGLKPQSPIAVKSLLQTYNVELEMYRDTGDFETGIARIDEIKHILEKPQSKIPADYRLLLFYQFAYLYFMKQRYRESLHWLNEIFAGKFGAVREDIQSYAQLLNLIIHFELGNITILKYGVETSRRFLKKKRELQPFEKVLLRFFSKISLARQEAYPELFRKLKVDLFRDTGAKVKKNALDYLNFEAWIA